MHDMTGSRPRRETATGASRPLPRDRSSVRLPNRQPTLGLVTGDPVRITDIGAYREHVARHAAEMGLIHTILGVPLLREDEPIGAFGLSRARVEPFTDRQIDLVRTFAAQAVIAIENAWLLEGTRQRSADLQQALTYQTATGEVLRIVASSPDRLAAVVVTRARHVDFG